MSSGRRDSSNTLLDALKYVAYGALVLVVILSVLVLVYGRILAGQKASKDAALAKAEASIDPATVTQFVRLRDRLDQGSLLLNSHVALSGLFNALETLDPSTVRFDTIRVDFGSQDTPQLNGSGTAKTFNALAAVSDAFATDGRIKDAIFSNITVNPNGSVSFSITATLDPKLIAYAPSAAPPATTGATTTAP
jgi:hypothetical protein